MARPTKLTPEIIALVGKLLPCVLHLESVGDYIGVEAKTWRRWFRRGLAERRRLAKAPASKPRKAEALYLDFAETAVKALAKGELRDMTAIMRASKKYWQAAAWRMERRFPARYGRQERATVDDLAIDRLIDEKLAALARQGQAPAPGEAPGPAGPG